MKPSDFLLQILKRLFRFWLWISYVTGSVILFFLLFIFLINVLIKPCNYLSEKTAKVIQIIQGDKTNYEFKSDHNEKLLKVYPEKNIREIEEIWRDSSGNPIDPTRDYPLPYRSKYANVSKKRYRLIKNQREYSRGKNQKNIFIFGGSTTWGYRLPDDETIASHFQFALDRKDKKFVYNVFNYGLCSGYSKYEKRYLERLIMDGKIPDYAIFIDGLNDFSRVALEWAGERDRGICQQVKIIEKYITNPYIFWRWKLLKLFGISPKMNDRLVKYDDESIKRACRELIANWMFIKGISKEYNIKCIFVLQPISVYDYPLEKNLFLSKADLENRRSYYMAANKGYQFLLESGMLDSFDYIDLHELRIQGYEYLDSCHYTSAFSKRIAESLFEEIAKDSDIVQD